MSVYVYLWLSLMYIHMQTHVSRVHILCINCTQTHREESLGREGEKVTISREIVKERDLGVSTLCPHQIMGQIGGENDDSSLRNDI